MYTKSELINVNHGLWVFLMCPCCSAVVTNVPSSGDTGKGEAVHVWRWRGTQELCYLPRSFPVNLKLP